MITDYYYYYYYYDLNYFKYLSAYQTIQVDRCIYNKYAICKPSLYNKVKVVAPIVS
jgi:hypothetical protein